MVFLSLKVTIQGCIAELAHSLDASKTNLLYVIAQVSFSFDLTVVVEVEDGTKARCCCVVRLIHIEQYPPLGATQVSGDIVQGTSSPTNSGILLALGCLTRLSPAAGLTHRL
jgi:hypothetical protein